MTRILLTTILVIAATMLVWRPGKASELPWCLIGYGGGNGRCVYNSLEDCLKDRAGGGGFCNPSPFYSYEQRRNAQPQPGRRGTRVR
jgi:hypothetical protein